MIRVTIFERHPAVLEGLRRRLEAEVDVSVVGAYSDLYSFEAGLKTLRPDVAIVSSVGAGAIPAANMASRIAGATKLLALVPGTRRNERLGFPASVEFVTDGPRGDLLVERLMRIGHSLQRGSARHVAS